MRRTLQAKRLTITGRLSATRSALRTADIRGLSRAWQAPAQMAKIRKSALKLAQMTRIQLAQRKYVSPFSLMQAVD